MKTMKLVNLTILVFEVFLCIAGFIGLHITFGHGLGDLFFFAILYISTLIHIIWSYKIRKAEGVRFIAPVIIFSLVTLVFALKATVLRGPEYSWKNRELFYNYNQDETEIFIE